jgi:hypothetical protein
VERKEAGKLLNYVKAAYPMFIRENDPVIILDMWTRALQDYDFDSVLDNLVEYTKDNEYPPKVSDLIKPLKKPVDNYNIPDVAATKKIMEKYKPAPEEERLTPEQAKQLVFEKLGWKL